VAQGFSQKKFWVFVHSKTPLGIHNVSMLSTWLKQRVEGSAKREHLLSQGDS
jgi:hypothetical protein